MNQRRPSGCRGLLPARPHHLPPLHTLAKSGVRAALPETFDASHGFTDIGMLGNGPDDTLTINDGQPVGDCFFAAVCHLLILKALAPSTNGSWVVQPDLIDAIQPTANHWVGLYLGYGNQLSPGQTATSGPDQGTEPVSGFQWLQAAGIIKRWGPVDLQQLDQATFDHNGVVLAVALDEGAEQEFADHQPWQNLPEFADPIVGGHAIDRAGFTTRYGIELTWGADQFATRSWEGAHIQNAYWLQAPWEPDHAAYDFASLDAALKAL